MLLIVYKQFAQILEVVDAFIPFKTNIVNMQVFKNTRKITRMLFLNFEDTASF
jgi:mannose/fructose/N-acetylgalactosamine-specific phosphotransferase system component IIB